MASEAFGDRQQVVVLIWEKEQEYQALIILKGEWQIVKENAGAAILGFRSRQASHEGARL